MGNSQSIGTCPHRQQAVELRLKRQRSVICSGEQLPMSELQLPKEHIVYTGEQSGNRVHGSCSADAECLYKAQRVCTEEAKSTPVVGMNPAGAHQNQTRDRMTKVIKNPLHVNTSPTVDNIPGRSSLQADPEAMRYNAAIVRDISEKAAQEGKQMVIATGSASSTNRGGSNSNAATQPDRFLKVADAIAQGTAEGGLHHSKVAVQHGTNRDGSSKHMCSRGKDGFLARAARGDKPSPVDFHSGTGKMKLEQQPAHQPSVNAECKDLGRRLQASRTDTEPRLQEYDLAVAKRVTVRSPEAEDALRRRSVHAPGEEKLKPGLACGVREHQKCQKSLENHAPERVSTTSEPRGGSSQGESHQSSHEGSRPEKSRASESKSKENGEVGRKSTAAREEESEESRNQLAVMVVGAGVGMAIHIAEHHLGKDNVHRGCGVGFQAAAAGEHGRAAAGVARADASCHAGEYTCGAAAGVKAAGASAAGKGIPGTGDLAAPSADVAVLDAGANASAGVLGARASAEATCGRVSVGLAGTPVAAGASGPTAGAGAGVHAGHIGFYAGAHVGQAYAGPFAVRAGLKFGMGIENGIPVLHEGPISTPCSIM